MRDRRTRWHRQVGRGSTRGPPGPGAVPGRTALPRPARPFGGHSRTERRGGTGRPAGRPRSRRPADPRELGAKAALYRDTLSGTRTLILLDNAVSTAQVRPLLPAAPGCLVMVTSRRRLVGLDDAHTLALGVLSLTEATSLIRMVAGPNRLAEDDPDLPELALLCGCLPLALRIAGSRLRHRRTLTVSDLAAQLRDEQSRLTRLCDEERDVAAVFETSYRGMRHDEQQLLLLLGRIPGGDIDPYAAAALLGTSHYLAESLLESLLDNNLVMQRTAGRYLLHDLVRLYARTLGTTDQADPEGSVEAGGHDAALERLLDYYQYIAHLADSHIAPRASRDRTVDCPVPGVVPPLPDLGAALQWMRAERDNLLAAALSTGPARTAALSGSLSAFLVQEGLPSQGAVLHRAAAAAAQELGDLRGQAVALDRLGRSRIMMGDYQGAAELQRQTLALHRGLGDRSGEATALWQLGRVHHMERDYPAAARCHEQALAIFRSLGDRLGEGNTLWALGRVRQQALDYEGATSLGQRALVIYRELGEGLGEANLLWNLGAIHRAQDDLPAAADLLEQALQAYQNLGHRLGEANARCELGYLRSSTGDYPAAAALFDAALETYSEIGERSGPFLVRHGLARLRLETGQALAAEELLQQLLIDYREAGVRDEEASALHDLARVRLALGDRAGAAGLLARARTLVEEIGDRRREAAVLHTTGSLLLDTARPDEALTCFRQALDLAREIRSPLAEARALEGVARCAVRSGDHAAALPDLRQAVALYRRSGAAEGAAAESLLTSLEPAGLTSTVRF
ncbi:tetratricopeptide repeat protein [Streptacidiphilus sp. 4-A2]|nr:tetratricopeptide repeat protein [Streptacidiphilus sp. 4-A2]